VGFIPPDRLRIRMGLAEAIVVFVVGYVSGTVTRWFAGIAAIAALVLAVLGLAAPASFFVFVDPDVDPLDTRAVLSAIALHADPDEDFHQFGVETMPKVPLNIYQTPEEKGDAETGTSKSKTAKAYIDATRGSDAPEPPTYLEDEPLRERARAVLAEAGVDPRRPVASEMPTRSDGSRAENGGDRR
jgi:4-hydroxy-3-polyprenylbenzoate decarboxylase